MDNGVAFVTGRLTRDPQFFGEGEKRRVVFSVAFNRGKEERRKTTFVDCIAWGKRADILESFTKGSGVALSGDLETDTWEDKEGQKHSRLRLNVSTITATTSNRKTEEDTSEESVSQEETAAVPAPRTGRNVKNGKTSESADLPF